MTADAVRERGIEPAFVATRASEDIAGGLGRIEGSRVFLPQADIADPHLADELRGKGAEVDAVIAYRTVLVEPPMWGILPLRIADAVVLASGSACRSLAAAAAPARACCSSASARRPPRSPGRWGSRSAWSPTRRPRTASFGRS